MDAFHEQPACVVTPTDPVPPAAATLADGLDTAYVHPGAAPACVTDTGDPPIMSVVVRDAVPVLADSAYVTLLGPFPDAGDSVVQATGLVAVQLQLSWAVNAIEPDPPAAPSDSDVFAGTAQPDVDPGVDEPAAA